MFQTKKKKKKIIQGSLDMLNFVQNQMERSMHRLYVTALYQYPHGISQRIQIEGRVKLFLNKKGRLAM